MKTRPTRTANKPSVKPTPQPTPASKPTPTPAPRAAKAPRAAGGAGASNPSILNLRALLPGAALLLLALLAYAPALRAGFIWDDNALTDNPLVTTFSGLWGVWLTPGRFPLEQHYWPLVYASFWLEHLVAGLNPFLYHLDNILLHGAVCILLWRVLRRLAVPGAWLAAALFAVHPVHAESVAWIIERKDVLSGLFYFGAALAFLHFHELPTTEPPRRRQRLYALSLALFAAALLSKSIAVTLPLALALALWLRHGRLTRRDLARLLPLLALAAVLTLADLHYVQARLQPGFKPSGLDFPERVLMAGRAAWAYLAKLAWPHPLAAFYPKWPVSLTSPFAWLPLLAGLALLAGLWLARRHLGRGPGAALAFFVLTLAPALGLLDFDYLRFTWVADRFQYLASAGPLALAAAALALLARRLRWPAAASRAAAALLLAALGLLCLRQAALYRDSATLFEACLRAYPQCWAAHANFGWTRQQAGRLDEAVAQYREALNMYPDDPWTLNNLGEALRAQGQPQEAEACLARAVSLQPGRADRVTNLALALADQEKYAPAAEQCRLAIQLDPNYFLAHLTLGQALLSMENPREAAATLEQALRLQPGSPEALYLLGHAHEVQGAPAEAARCYRQALQARPDFAQAAESLKALEPAPAPAQ